MRPRRASCLARARAQLGFLWSVGIILAYYAVAYGYYHEREGWGLVDSVYFAVVTCTTIGYGDIVPTTDESKLFTVLFGTAGIFIVMVAIQDVGAWMAVQQNAASAAAMRALLAKTVSAAERNKGARYAKKEATAEQAWKKRRERAKAGATHTLRCCSKALLCVRAGCRRALRFLLFLDAWLAEQCEVVYTTPRDALRTVFGIAWPVVAYLALGACMGPFEGWTLAESVYFASVTVLTIGYGDLRPTTAAGKIFCIFYIPMALGVMMATFHKVKDMRILRRTRTVSLKTILTMDEDADGKVSEVEFLRAHLRATGYSAEHLDTIQEQFRVLDRTNTGFLTPKVRSA